MSTTMAERADDLVRQGVPFVRATVVRAQEPTSARPGDRAIILADGSMEGFVGGQCAAGSVRTAALGILASGESLLLRVLPESAEGFPDSPGAEVVVNPCLSGGAIEVYLEPLLPSPLVQLTGTSPTAEAVALLAPTLGFRVRRGDTGDHQGSDAGPATVAIISTHGGDEAGAVRAALEAGIGFVGVVCSRTRGGALLDELALDAEDTTRVHVHVGLDIGARTAPEVALSILAAVVRAIRAEGLAVRAGGSPETKPRTAVDPVCGMTVTVGPDTPHAMLDGMEYWFCMPGCRDTFLASHGS
ncbi:MAG TPA: XdhC family protein [Nocardioides sp.]|nr:XdhC family protein [Nocardioides sp.]